MKYKLVIDVAVNKADITQLVTDAIESAVLKLSGVDTVSFDEVTTIQE